MRLDFAIVKQFVKCKCRYVSIYPGYKLELTMHRMGGSARDFILCFDAAGPRLGRVTLPRGLRYPSL